MNSEDTFLAWAPDESPWSRWAKPILFATMPPHIYIQSDANPLPLPASDWGLSPSRETAVILDLPSETSVHAGIALAQKGWRPVPLFNGCHDGSLDLSSQPIVSTTTLSRALVSATPLLQQCRLPHDAPPAFLLDSRRLSGASMVSPGHFDNRWCVVPQDMPSANHLAAKGIRRVVVCTSLIMDDLAHILRRYQEARIELQIMHEPLAPPSELNVPRPRFFRSVWHRILVMAGLHRNAAGGFGSLIPIPSASGTG